MTVVVLVHGRRRYFSAAREAIRSVLARTPFSVAAVVGPGRGRLWLRSRRIQRIPVPMPTGAGRAASFLLKFHALRVALEQTRTSHLLLLDADAVFAADVEVTDVLDALGSHPIGMVEQTCIRGGEMTTARLREFAYATMLPFFGPVPAELSAGDLTYFNSGVVLATREALAQLTEWALARIEAHEGPHEVGEHFVGDQDYFQYWVNVLHPGTCARLPWSWNHCEHWDDPFPRLEGKILHFSNFCNGPRRFAARRMRAARRGGPRAVEGLRQ